MRLSSGRLHARHSPQPRPHHTSHADIVESDALAHALRQHELGKAGGHARRTSVIDAIQETEEVDAEMCVSGGVSMGLVLIGGVTMSIKYSCFGVDQ